MYSYIPIQCTLWVGFPGGAVVKNPPANTGDRRGTVPSLGQEDPLEEGMATHCTILAWKIPWTEEPGRRQFIGSPRAGHDLATKTTIHFVQGIFYASIKGKGEIL